MERSLTRFCLAALVVFLVTGSIGAERHVELSGTEAVPERMTRADSLAQKFFGGIIPDWAVHQDSPTTGSRDPADFLAAGLSIDCPPSFDMDLASERNAVHFDSVRDVWEFYDADPDNSCINRYDFAADLSYSTAIIPIANAAPWLAEDLNQDGSVEIVSQWGDQLLIHSSPGGALLAQFEWSGFNVVMNPAAANIDDDRFIEIFVTPHTLGGTARAVIIKYDSLAGSFMKLADIALSTNAAGRPAVGDFDEDGRFEFISGNNFIGYELFEWQDPNLVHIGMVGDTTYGNNFSAVACRPKPGGVLHALLGHSSSTLGFRYQLLAPTGDNTFEVVQVFQESTGYIGMQPCQAADTDCDGLDEMAMCFHPTYRVWQWSASADAFIEGCTWSREDFGSMIYWYAVDLDQDHSAEWGVVNHIRHLFVFPDPTCVYCDTLGVCPAVAGCFCACAADPACDGQVDVLDVVSAVDVAFRSGSPAFDPFPQCPFERTDVDCSGFTNVLDVVHIVNVAFRSGDPISEFCHPCP